MNTHCTYFFILAAAVAGPLGLSFDKKVRFYKNWKHLFPAMLIPAFLYIVWDSYFTSINVWGFNEKYITGVKLGNLPVEEILFFFIVPYCCVFIYQCIRVYFPGLKKNKTADTILKLLGVVLLLTGLFFYNKNYTSWTFVLCAIFIAVIYRFKYFFRNFDAAPFLFSFAIILIPFLIVNGFLTALPVVLYNNAENLGVKIYTIPVEDVFYGMLFTMMNVAIYEKAREVYECR